LETSKGALRRSSLIEHVKSLNILSSALRSNDKESCSSIKCIKCFNETKDGRQRLYKI